MNLYAGYFAPNATDPTGTMRITVSSGTTVITRNPDRARRIFRGRPGAIVIFIGYIGGGGGSADTTDAGSDVMYGLMGWVGTQVKNWKVPGRYGDPDKPGQWSNMFEETDKAGGNWKRAEDMAFHTAVSAVEGVFGGSAAFAESMLGGFVGDRVAYWDEIARRDASHEDEALLVGGAELEEMAQAQRYARYAAYGLAAMAIDAITDASNSEADKFGDKPEDMDDYLGFEGERVPDGPNTPGRGKVIWKPNGNTKITYEAHPYDAGAGAPPSHTGPHWHVDTPTMTHKTYVPGDPIPGQ
ncbi:MAG: hypothetical protein GXP38_00410 [Chloroflexi bacterium]|nr:hypothetical protein [Chloroflexota bacterium]